MKASLSRRLSLLESRTGKATRRMHIVTAIDEDDRDRQKAELLASGKAGPSDGFLCLTGKSANSTSAKLAIPD